MTDDDDPDLFDYGLYDGSPPAQKHSDTSRAAAESIRKRIGPLHREILSFLKQRPRGATDEEMQTEIPMPANTQRPRRIELTQMERLADSGRRKLTGSKRHAVIWVLISEVFPGSVRGKGQSLGSFTHWFFAALITFLFPAVVEKTTYGSAHAFAFFAAMMVVQVITVWKYFPETKGKTLEELGQELLKRA